MPDPTPEDIAGQGAETCRRCGGPNPSWSAPSPLWNAVMRGGSINGDPLYSDLVCVTCFTVIAEDRGIASGWRLTAQHVNTPLETVTPSGRVWSDDAFLWIGDPAHRDGAFLPSAARDEFPTSLADRGGTSAAHLNGEGERG